MSEKLKSIADSIKQAKPVEAKENKFLPSKCPVIPLGTKKGMYYYIDALGQFRELKDKDHGRTILLGLLGSDVAFCKREYPKKNADGGVNGWKPDEFGKDLMAECACRGVWEPFERVRGAGVWIDDDDQIVIHSGDVIIKNNIYINPGVCGAYVYPSEPARQRPWDNEVRPEEFGEFYALLKTWAWRRPEIDPMLLLGWIGAASIGGALKWRPLMWLSGDRGTGKSTLQEVINFVFNKSILSVSDPTPAAIFQKIGFSSLPVALDEMEPEADSKRVQSIIKLARQACSGGVILRGSAEGNASEFKARNCYLFSSILVPALLPQDRSRMAILELDRITGTPPRIKRNELAVIGSKILRRMIDKFDDFYTNIEMLRAGFSNLGFDSRGCDQFGTLIAAAQVLLFDYPMTSDDVQEMCESMRDVIEAEKFDNDANHIQCRDHLLTSILDTYKDGRKRSIGDWIAQAAGRDNTNKNEDADNAHKTLAAIGIKVEDEIIAGEKTKCLLIATKHQGLAKIYKETDWAGGVWTQAFRRFKNAAAFNTRRFGGVASKCTIIPLDEILGKENENGQNL